MLVLAIFGPLLAPDDPNAVNLLEGSQTPSSAHLLGTDQVGRDVLSRTMVGARTAIVGPLVISLASILIATVAGLLAGYISGVTDTVLSRICDVIYALPALLVAIVVVGILGGGYWLAISVLIVLNIPWLYRNLRAAVIEQRGLPYIEAAQVLDMSRWRIMRVQVLPNIVPIVLSTFFLCFTYAFVDLSTLSFLGLGVAPGTPDWGRMVAESRILIFENPWGALAPLILIIGTALSANLLGDALDDRLRTGAKGR
ncbi:MAG: ABC transporter permease [Actinobacteria bacterium]|nr:ABC transporter permease [Actinomycetota bacterium]